MVDIDTWLHILGIELLVIFGLVWLLLDKQPIKRTVSTLFLLLLGIMLTHAVTHLLPNAMARFIYSSHLTYYSKKA